MRDHYRVEDRESRRFWAFRRNDGIDGDTSATHRRPQLVDAWRVRLRIAERPMR